MTLGIGDFASLCLLDPGAPHTQRHIVLTFAGHGAGMTTHASSQVNNHTVAIAFYSLGNCSSFLPGDRNAGTNSSQRGRRYKFPPGSQTFLLLLSFVICYNSATP